MYGVICLYRCIIGMIESDVWAARTHGVLHPLDPERDDQMADAIKEIAVTIDRIRERSSR